LPEFLPFAGIRYDCATAGTELDKLAAPPYDVVDEDEQASLEGAHSHNAVRLILPRDEARAGDRYDCAKAAFEQWHAAGVLVRDGAPRFYGYRMIYRDPHGRPRHTQGVIGALGLPDPGDETILPHERTLPKAKSDRLSLLRAMRVNVDPIWGLTLGTGLTALLQDATLLCTCTDPDGVRHELSGIDDPATIAAITEIVGGAPLVLADGHHRFETAKNYRAEQAGPDAGADAIMALVVELVDDELCIEPIHRLLELPAGVDVRERLGDAFEIRDAGPITPEGVDALVAAMAAEHALGLVDANGLALAVVRGATRDPIDAAVVEELVVPRLPEASWQYRHDAAACAFLVDKGNASAAVLCSPVSVAQTRAVSLAGERMPQKTTFFWPKPRTGMVFRALD
jgi:uncharacterized protein (DUF1015 family)